MNTNRRLMISFITVMFLFSFVLSGCGSTKSVEQNTTSTAEEQSASASTTQGTELAPVELIYQAPWAGSTDELPAINEAMNKILKAKINATIKINAIDLGQYDQKMNVINAGGDDYDLAFTAYWSNNYYKNVANNVLLALDDLLPEYAPNLWKAVPEKFWDATRVNGKIYAAQNYQIGVESYGFYCDMNFLDMIKEKTGYTSDINSFKKLEDLEPLLAAIKKASIPKTIGFLVRGGAFAAKPAYFGFDTVGDVNSPGWIRLTDDDTTVINQYESQEYMDYCKLMRKWFQAGYIRKDAALLKSGEEDKGYDYYGPNLTFAKPGDAETYTTSKGRPIKITTVTTPVCTTQRASATLTGISAKSKNPERAMMYLDMMGSNELLYNTLNYGFTSETGGKYYIKTGDKSVDYNEGIDPKTVPYSMPALGWAIGNQFLAWLTPNTPKTVWEDTIKMNETAIGSPILGFSFDPTPVKTEIAACQTVLDEFRAGLETGSVDPEVYLPKMIEKLKTAGADKIIEEDQKQINAWKATKAK